MSPHYCFMASWIVIDTKMVFYIRFMENIQCNFVEALNIHNSNQSSTAYFFKCCGIAPYKPFSRSHAFEKSRLWYRYAPSHRIVTTLEPVPFKLLDSVLEEITFHKYLSRVLLQVQQLQRHLGLSLLPYTDLRCQVGHIPWRWISRPQCVMLQIHS